MSKASRQHTSVQVCEPASTQASKPAQRVACAHERSECRRKPPPARLRPACMVAHERSECRPGWRRGLGGPGLVRRAMVRTQGAHERSECKLVPTKNDTFAEESTAGACASVAPACVRATRSIITPYSSTCEVLFFLPRIKTR
jgi:hypothetical protein